MSFYIICSNEWIRANIYSDITYKTFDEIPKIPHSCADWFATVFDGDRAQVKAYFEEEFERKVLVLMYPDDIVHVLKEHFQLAHIVDHIDTWAATVVAQVHNYLAIEKQNNAVLIPQVYKGYGGKVISEKGVKKRKEFEEGEIVHDEEQEKQGKGTEEGGKVEKGKKKKLADEKRDEESTAQKEQRMLEVAFKKATTRNDVTMHEHANFLDSKGFAIDEKRKIGTGATATVFATLDSKYAVKIIRFNQVQTTTGGDYNESDFVKEVGLQKELCRLGVCPDYIADFIHFHAASGKTFGYLITEYWPCSVQDLSRSSLTSIRKVVIEMLHRLHRLGEVVHGDIRDANIVFRYTHEKQGIEDIEVGIIDWGKAFRPKEFKGNELRLHTKNMRISLGLSLSKSTSDLLEVDDPFALDLQMADLLFICEKGE